MELAERLLIYELTIRGKCIVIANFLFPQVSFQTQPPDVERGMMGGSVQNRSAVSKTGDELSEDSHESFLNTLEQLSKDNKPNKQTQGAGEGKSSETHTFDSADTFDATACRPTGLETGISELTKQPEEDPDNMESQIPPALNLKTVISMLEKLGLYDSAGGSSSANKVDGILGNAEGLAALKMLIARLGQKELVLSAEMKAELDRLQQFIANVQSGNASSPNDGNPMGELADSRSTESADLNQLIKRIVSGQEDQRSSSGVHMRESDSGEKPSGPFAAKLPNDIKQTGSFQLAQDSQATSRSENREKTESLKLAVEAPPAGAEAGENAKEPKSLETVRTDGSGLKDGSDTPGKTGAPSQAGLLNRIPPTIDSGKQFDGESAPQNLLNNESSPVSKMIHDSQLAKENHMRMVSAMSDEFGGKVTKVDAGATDNGLQSSQNQTAEKAFEATSPSRQTDIGQNSLRTQTLDQIVRKAVIYMRNGQHEAKIVLKPEFLGHVRMQVTTDNHQVTVKILTEFGFIKDMVENNIHQLKADLQQQGLNVDKLEVSVSHDSDKYEDSRQEAGRAKDRLRNVDHKSPENPERETREQTGNSGLRTAGTSTVDYFA
jgi:flagellar hook-length control protein FliK